MRKSNKKVVTAYIRQQFFVTTCIYIYQTKKIKSKQNKTKRHTPPKKTHQPTNPLEDQKFTKMSSHAKGKN